MSRQKRNRTKEAHEMLSIEHCENLTTPRLLAFYKKNLWRRGSFACSCCGEYLMVDDQRKNDAINEYLDSIRTILNGREHVE